MKSATFPSLRVDPALREAAEAVLEEGESLSAFVERSVRAQIALRQAQDAFIARGLASRDAARAGGRYVSAAVALGKLERRLAKAKRSA
jgi:predicted transcriptional regulator